jgi:hypothetical protein
MYWENFHRIQIEKFIEKHFPHSYNNDLYTFFASPSFFNLERFLSIKYDDKIAMVFGVIIGLFLLFLPFIVLGYFFINNIQEWSLINSLFFKIVVLCINGLFFIRNEFLAFKVIKL